MRIHKYMGKINDIMTDDNTTMEKMKQGTGRVKGAKARLGFAVLSEEVGEGLVV